MKTKVKSTSCGTLNPLGIVDQFVLKKSNEIYYKFGFNNIDLNINNKCYNKSNFYHHYR